MEKQCCEMKVTEIENGYKIEITGDDIKEKCKTVMSNCCAGDNLKKCFKSFCSPSTGKGGECC